jgi:DGQHR domain-containing protein
VTDKGEELNRRVWRLFEAAGFETKPNSSDPAEEVVVLPSGGQRALDLSASVEDLGVKIIGWNTTSSRLRRPLSVHINDYEVIRKTAKADSVLFVLTRKAVQQSDRDYAESLGMRIWGDHELRYYEALVGAIGEYAKYEIIHSFGIRTREEKLVYSVLALRVRQPRADSGTALYMFALPAERLLRTCCVFRKAQEAAGAYQRILDKRRLPGIASFISQNDAILPTNIVLHLSDRVRWEPIAHDGLLGPDGRPAQVSRIGDCDLGTLRFPMEYASMELIDGQHRLFGFVKADPSTRESYNLVVLGIEGLSSDKRRDTFVAVNQNARRVNANLVSYLKYTDDEIKCQNDSELMAIKVVVELSKTTPFKDRIRLYDMGSPSQVITLKGFSGYDLRGLLGKRGLLRKHYPSNTSADYVKALRLYFGILKKLFPNQWNDPKKYIIFTNRGISAFLKLLKSILRTCESPLSKEIVEKYLQSLKDRKTDANWVTADLRSAYIGSKGWKNFHQDLVATICKDYPDFKE